MSGQVLAFGLRRSFGSEPALDGVDLSLEGGLTAILGPNGAGKSTLLRCLATVDRPDEGTLLIDGLDPSFETDRVEVRRRLGYLPQAHGLEGSGRLFDTLDYFAVLKDCGDERQRRHMVFDALERVGLDERANDSINTLSGGMRQRLGLAQAILAAPSLLVLDEPASGLDPDERFRLREIMAERRLRSTVVVATHLTDDAAFCDKVIVLDGGRARFVGTPADLANVAEGRAWLQDHPPAGPLRASWLQADGRHRCLGDPPDGAELVPTTLEDGYLFCVEPVGTRLS